MGKVLVLAEKPSVGKELARVLDCRNAKNGYIVGNKYIVTWSLGHLVTLADPEDYSDAYKQWSLESLPMIPQKMQLVVIKETGKQFGVVRTLLHSNEVDSLVIATDAGREGELVARWIIAKAGFKKPIKRLWISSQTDKAIREGFASLKPAAEYHNLFMAAQSRAEADWLVGLNVTRALTCKFNAQLSAGRVQTPTLSIIIQREEEIKKFISKEYYCINARTENMSLNWRNPKTGDQRLFSKDAATDLLKKIQGKKAKILRVAKEYKRKQPPLLYDLTQLQIDANKRYGFSAKKTLSLMQTLYETHKALTYPRTDSKYITTDIVPTLKERIKSISGGFSSAAQNLLRNGFKVGKRVADNQKVSDHHAIIPTEQFVNMSSLSSEEKYIYNMVVMRFLQALSADYEYEQVSITAEIGGEQFFANGSIAKNLGWRSIGESYDDDEPAGQNLPLLSNGATLDVRDVTLVTASTKPPSRYTEATLLGAMEHPGKMVDNADLREALDKANGLGTPATRADIIDKLFNVGYCELRGKEIFPTSKGIQLIGIVPPDLKSAELTGKWEQRLNDISKGKAPYQAFNKEIRAYTQKLVSSVIASTASYRHDNMTRTRCPNCDKFLLEIKGKKGVKLVCQDRECGYKENVSFLSNARCPNCHKQMEIYGQDEKKKYICKCGFKEKYATFNDRMRQNHSSMGKRELNEYMRKQEAAKPMATLGDLLKNLQKGKD